MAYTQPGSSVHRISQARTLEWVAISLSKASFQPRNWNRISYMGRWILYYWATREALLPSYMPPKGMQKNEITTKKKKIRNPDLHSEKRGDPWSDTK